MTTSLREMNMRLAAALAVDTRNARLRALTQTAAPQGAPTLPATTEERWSVRVMQSGVVAAAAGDHSLVIIRADPTRWLDIDQLVLSISGAAASEKVLLAWILAPKLAPLAFITSAQMMEVSSGDANFRSGSTVATDTIATASLPHEAPFITVPIPVGETKIWRPPAPITLNGARGHALAIITQVANRGLDVGVVGADWWPKA
jgi:hypothetical protein